MKKIFLGAAAVAMLGLASCSSKTETATDTATVNSDTLVEAAQVTEVTVDCPTSDSPVVEVQQATEVTESTVPAAEEAPAK